MRSAKSHSSSLLGLFCLTTIGLALLAPAIDAQRAPAGFRTYGNDLAPIRFYYPRAYSEIPLPPTEKVMIARYILKRAPRELSKAEERAYKNREAQLYAFHFVRPKVTTPSEGEAKEGGDEKEEKKGPRNVREAMESRSTVSNWAEFKSRRLRGLKLVEVKGEEGHYELYAPANKPPSEAQRSGYLIMKREGEHVMGVFGLTFPSHSERMRRDVTKMSWGLDLRRESKKSFHEDQLDKLYARKDYKGVERRKKVRRELAKGWKALDTENYILVYHTPDVGLVRRIGRDIEAMRKIYEGIFPSEKPIEAVSIVRICKDKEEYHRYGGPPRSGGYWHPGNEELVFFDYDQEQRSKTRDEKKNQRRRLTDKDSMLVLYHEAFHQYIHYSVGEFNPHDWFNEGFGDYFSGAIIPNYSKTVREIGPSAWRINIAKNQCEYGLGFVPLKRLLKAERGEFYHPARAGLYYAAAWSFIYFLNKAEIVKQNPKWDAIIQTYFSSIKKHYKAELGDKLETATLQEKHQASAKARVKAVADATRGIDLAKLQKAWREYVIDMKNPWKHLRQVPDSVKDKKKR
jgi:hypothetical protein